jgi:hypothetical protein
VKQLHLEGYVPSFTDEPVPADLVRPMTDFVNALKADKKWQAIFEGEADIRGIAVEKFTTRTAPGSKTARTEALRNLPKGGLKFTIIFTFKSTAPPPKPPPAKGAPVRPAKPN